ncbi:MAG: hypothetical protein NTV01_00115 [Bacteroidia bacterium]|nr:hypothetical protein [Bacteroidia bacterium]
MTTYLRGKPFKISRQEGDTADIVFHVPDCIPMTGMDVLLQVRNASGDLLFGKRNTPTGGITVDNQRIHVSLDPIDTIGYHGTHNWELQVSNSIRVQTLAGGVFIIIREIAV